MTTYLHHLLPTDDDPADDQDTANNSARDKAQAEKFRQFLEDSDGDPTLILAPGDDLAKLRRDLLPFEELHENDAE